MIIDWIFETGFAGCVHEGEIEVEDDATDEEISEAVMEEAMNFVDISWEKRGNIEEKAKPSSSNNGFAGINCRCVFYPVKEQSGDKNGTQ